MLPSAIQECMTVNRFLSLPVVRIATVDAPLRFTLVALGRSNVNGVWSAFNVIESGGESLSRVLMM